jgi:hypothetical protein
MAPREDGKEKTPRPAIYVQFDCCNAYARVLLNKAGTAYAGHCPKCARPIHIRVASGGSGSKFWRAG